MPLALDLTSTLVMGSILPVATTLFAKVSLLDLGELRGVDLGAAAGCDQRAGNHQDHNDCCYRAPDDDSLAPLFLAVTVAFHDRLLLEFKS